MNSYVYIYNLSSMPVMKGSSFESIYEAKKEYKKLL